MCLTDSFCCYRQHQPVEMHKIPNSSYCVNVDLVNVISTKHLETLHSLHYNISILGEPCFCHLINVIWIFTPLFATDLWSGQGGTLCPSLCSRDFSVPLLHWQFNNTGHQWKCMKLIVEHHEGMSTTAAGGILLHHQVTWHTQTHTLYPSDPSAPPLPCRSLMLCTVREGKGRRVLEEGGGGGAAEREAEQSEREEEEEKERQWAEWAQITTNHRQKQGRQERGGLK